MDDLIRKYVGTPFQHGGRDPDRGLDCIGLVVCFLRENGIHLPDDDGAEIQRDWYRQDYMRMVRGLEGHGEKVSREDVKPLDIAVFCINGVPRHAGVMVGRDKFLHIRQNNTATVERLSKRKRLFYAAYRIGGDG